MKLILVKSQKTGDLYRAPMDAKLDPDLRKVKKLGGRNILKEDGSLIDSFHQIEILEG